MEKRVIALLLYPYPLVEADLRALKSAKAKLDVDYLIKPSGAAQGLSGRVLCLRDVPPWIVWDGYAFVPDVDNVQSMMAALHWATTIVEDKRAMTLEKQMAKFGYREIDERKLAVEGLSRKMHLNSGSTPTFREE